MNMVVYSNDHPSARDTDNIQNKKDKKLNQESFFIK